MRNTAKRILCILCAFFMLLPVAGGIRVQAAEGLDLAQMQIVLPASATAVEQMAATELQTYVNKITGTSPVIKTEGQHSGACVYVGATGYAAQNNISYPTEGDENGEAWAIQAVGRDLVLCGAPTRGPLYAVYHLLEDVLGVRWWNIWEEDVPTGDAIVPEGYADSGVPVMEYRGAFMGIEANKDYQYFVRNRMNSNLGDIPEAYGSGEVYGAPSHVHTFGRYFGAADYAAHPEWFALIDGVRDYSGQLCLSSAGLRKEYADRMLKDVAKAPDAIYSVSPDDNTKFCQCEDCQKAIESYGSSGYVLDFVNEMAAAVSAAGYTDTAVEMLVYWVYVTPPKGGVTPADNVMLRFADNFTDLLHGLDHENNAESMENLKAWIALCDNDIYYWQYVVVYLNNGVFPSMFHYGEDFTALQELGVNGWFAEQEQCINVDFWDMKQWLIAKLMEKPVSGEEYASLMDEFIYGYYGEEAGKYIRDYLYYMHEKAEATNMKVTFGTGIIDAPWLSVQDIIKGNEYFEKAVAAAGDDGVLQRRLRSARCGLDRVIHENYGSWKQQAEDEGLTLSFTKQQVGMRIYQTMTEQIALRGAYDPDYAQFYNSYARRYGAQQIQLPDGFEGVARQHILDYNADDFRLAYDYSVVMDSASQFGKAVCCKAETRLAAGSNSLILKNGNAIRVAVYDPDGLGGSQYYDIGEITAGMVKAGEGYQLYSFRWRVPAMGSGAYVYMFNDWGVQNQFIAQEMQDMVGQTVEVYISMKVEGVIDGSDPLQYPEYYIDRIFVLPEKENWAHNYEAAAGTAEGTVCKTVCTVCGDVIESEHIWNTGVTVKEPTSQAPGEKQLTCLSCGAVRTEALEKLPRSPKDHTALLIAAGVTLNLAAVVLLAAVIRKRKKG